LEVEGPNGSVSRRLWYPDVSVEVDGDTVVIESENDDAKTMSTLGTFESHVRNMFHGVTEGWEYELEVFYSHFPMQVEVEGDEVAGPNNTLLDAAQAAHVAGDEMAARECSGEPLAIASDSGRATRIASCSSPSKNPWTPTPRMVPRILAIPALRWRTPSVCRTGRSRARHRSAP
ncbi:MAG: 50S ribosomal protein L6, partial [Halochromatium sp.]